MPDPLCADSTLAVPMAANAQKSRILAARSDLFSHRETIGNADRSAHKSVEVDYDGFADSGPTEFIA